MANRLLKGLAVAAGTGLALGFSSGRARVRAYPRSHASGPQAPAPRPPQTDDPTPLPDDEFLNIEPLLDRLERVEARIELIEHRALPVSPVASVVHDAAPNQYFAAIAELERRVLENTHELTLLRERVTDAERRLTDSVVSVQKSVERTRQEIPAFVEQQVAARVDDLRNRFSAEIALAQKRTLETFERTIDEKISSRIGAIERALTDQAGSIDALRVRAAETDTNLQRLVSAIEKLCERAQLVSPVTERQYETRLPFESQLHEAMSREPSVPVRLTEERHDEAPVAVPAFAAGTPKKPRFLFGSLIVAGFSLFASRFIR